MVRPQEESIRERARKVTAEDLSIGLLVLMGLAVCVLAGSVIGRSSMFEKKPPPCDQAGVSEDKSTPIQYFTAKQLLDVSSQLRDVSPLLEREIVRLCEGRRIMCEGWVDSIDLTGDAPLVFVTGISDANTQRGVRQSILVAFREHRPLVNTEVGQRIFFLGKINRLRKGSVIIVESELQPALKPLPEVKLDVKEE